MNRDDVERLLEEGVLVTPGSHRRFERSGDTWVWPGETREPLAWTPFGGAVVLDGEERAKVAALLDGESARPHAPERAEGSVATMLRRFLRTEGRGHPSFAAGRKSFLASPGPLVSVGGGPSLFASDVFNLNLFPAREVHIVGSAYQLPFPDDALGGVCFMATLEHLRRPAAAVAEAFRALRPGGFALGGTPFLWAFHGYPSHYQNLTLIGHQALFEDQGFDVVDSGVLSGPGSALLNYVRSAVNELPLLPPGRFRRGVNLGLYTVARLLSPAAKLLDLHPRAHILAGETWVLARKPA